MIDDYSISTLRELNTIYNITDTDILILIFFSAAARSAV